MAESRKRPATPRRSVPSEPVASGGGRDGYHDGGYDGRDDDGENPESVAAHAQFVERHFGGGAAASAELLDRASAVWRRLPGAVVGVAGQLRAPRPGPGPDELENGADR